MRTARDMGHDLKYQAVFSRFLLFPYEFKKPVLREQDRFFYEMNVSAFEI